MTYRTCDETADALTSAYTISVTASRGRWRVDLSPALPNELSEEAFDDREMAMARARLLRLRLGFPIVAAKAGGGIE